MRLYTLDELVALSPPDAQLIVPDAGVLELDEDWLLQEFAQGWTEYLKANGLEYGANWDCNRFALLWMGMLCVAHRKANPVVAGQTDVGPAARIIHYWRDDGIRHAICGYLKNGEQRWIEPQPNAQGQAGRPTRLSPKELGSAFFCYWG